MLITGLETEVQIEVGPVVFHEPDLPLEWEDHIADIYRYDFGGPFAPIDVWPWTFPGFSNREAVTFWGQYGQGGCVLLTFNTLAGNKKLLLYSKSGFRISEVFNLFSDIVSVTIEDPWNFGGIGACASTLSGYYTSSKLQEIDTISKKIDTQVKERFYKIDAKLPQTRECVEYENCLLALNGRIFDEPPFIFNEIKTCRGKIGRVVTSY